MKKKGTVPVSDDELIATCHRKAVELLKRNLSPAGILAATPSPHAKRRGYTAIFGRDAAICAIGMALSGDKELERAAAAGLRTLAKHQAKNGQIPKFVDVEKQEADFWYLGCIDSTLWWLIGIAFLDKRKLGGKVGLRKRYAKKVKLAIQWLLAQEHQRFWLLQQNEASDWADIMPRSGFVLYTNALWYHVKRVYGIAKAEETKKNFNGLFHPFSAGVADYRRARLLNNYARENAKNRDLFLSFVNFASFGDEGDVFGNVLAVLLGLTDERASQRTMNALIRARASEPFPVRSVIEPITQRNVLWRPYMARHRQNHAWQYHNGGIWPMVGGFWIAMLAQRGKFGDARRELSGLAHACQSNDWKIPEWLHGKTLAPRGMPGQSWNAAGFLIAESALSRGGDVLAQ